MARAIWNGTILAESDNTVVVEGNHYFPPDSVNKKHLEKSSHSSVCPWKGEASYYTVEVDGSKSDDVAWFYPKTKEAAAEITGYVAFWRGVEVSEST